MWTSGLTDSARASRPFGALTTVRTRTAAAAVQTGRPIRSSASLPIEKSGSR